MNPLGELLDDVSAPSSEEVQQATLASLRELRHDARAQRLSTERAWTDACERVVSGAPATDVRILRPWLVERTGPERRRTYGATPLFWFEVSGDVPEEQPEALSGLRLADVPLRCQVRDRRQALVLLDESDPWLVEEPALVAALLELHSRTWFAAERLGPEPSDVLRELVLGRTDDAAAIHLHMSLRTYRRRVQELLTALGAPSRFAAGARAQALGLLDLLPENRPQLAS